MANSNTDALIPEFWAGSFDEFDKGQYPLINLVDRKYEMQLGSYGDIVHVPISPDATAVDWVPGDAITAAAKTQTIKDVVLNVSKRHTFNLTAKELSLTPYELWTTYGVPAIEAMRAAADEAVYKEFLASTYFLNGFTTFNEDTVVDAGTGLSGNKIAKTGRRFVLAPGDSGTLQKVDAFQFANQSGTMDVMAEGMIGRKLGFDFYESNGISIYTPADVAGTVNLLAGYAAGVSTIAVATFNDDLNPIRIGDIVTFADEAGTPQHTITGTTLTAGDTTGITFYPPLVDAIADTTVVTITPSRSALAFVRNAVAFAARPYDALPAGAGVNSRVVAMDDLPIRISTWHDGALGINVQYDILCGAKLIDARRAYRVIID